jgi:hypothetical protein
MLAVRVYALVWLISAAAAVAAGVYAGGFFSEMMLAILGFYFSTLVAVGFVMVLPAWVKDHYAPKYQSPSF